MLLLLNVVLLLLSIENAATSPADITGNPLFSHDPHDDGKDITDLNMKKKLMNQFFSLGFTSVECETI